MEKLKDKVEKYINKTGVIRTPAYFIKDLFNDIISKFKSLTTKINQVNSTLNEIINKEKNKEYLEALKNGNNCIIIKRKNNYDGEVPIVSEGDERDFNEIYIDGVKITDNLFKFKKDTESTIIIYVTYKYYSFYSLRNLDNGLIEDLHIYFVPNSSTGSKLSIFRCKNLYVRDLNILSRLDGLENVDNIYENNKLIDISNRNDLNIMTVDKWHFHKNITEIYIPDTVKTVTAGAFNDFPKLKKISFPPNVYINDITFNSPNLETIEFRGFVKNVRLFGITNVKELTINGGSININLPSLEKINVENYNYSLHIVSDNELDIYIDKVHVTGASLSDLPSKINTLHIKNCDRDIFSGLKINKLIVDRYSSAFIIKDNLILDKNNYVIFIPNTEEITLPDYVKYINGADINKTKILNISYNTELNQFPSNHTEDLIKINIPNNSSRYIKYNNLLCKDDTLFWCDKDVTEVVFPSQENISTPINIIGELAFNNCKNIKDIVIPDYITTIEHRIFKGCDELETITLSENTINVDRNSFTGCKNLKTINTSNYIGISSEGLDNLENMTNCYFYSVETLKHLTKLKEINILKSSDSQLSNMIYNIKDLNIDKVNVLIKDSEGNITKYEYTDKILDPETNKCIGIIPTLKSITFIEEDNFINDNFSCLKTGRSLTNIYFDNVNIELDGINQYACDNVKYFEVNNIANYSSTSEGWILKNNTCLIAIPKNGTIDNGVIPEYITEIGDYALYNYLEGIQGTNRTYTRIGKYAFAYTKVSIGTFNITADIIDQYAFCGATGQYSPRAKVIGAYAFKDAIISFYGLSNDIESIGDYAFAGAVEISNYEISLYLRNLKELGNYAFRDSNMATIEIDTDITLPINSIRNCKYLKTLDLNNSTPQDVLDFDNVGIHTAGCSMRFKVIYKNVLQTLGNDKHNITSITYSKEVDYD